MNDDTWEEWGINPNNKLCIRNPDCNGQVIYMEYAARCNKCKTIKYVSDEIMKQIRDPFVELAKQILEIQ